MREPRIGAEVRVERAQNGSKAPESEGILGASRSRASLLFGRPSATTAVEKSEQGHRVSSPAEETKEKRRRALSLSAFGGPFYSARV